MRVLVSAYACEPERGSEPGVGWHWALAAAARHDVVVVTRANNRPAIERAVTEMPSDRLPHFEYLDVPSALRFKHGSRGVRLYYVQWQRALNVLARRLHEEHRFDVLHHVTLAADWLPSGLVPLADEVPLVWGPVGGATATPWSLARWMTPGGLAKEVARTVTATVGRRTAGRSAASAAAVVLALNSDVAADLGRRQVEAHVVPHAVVGDDRVPARRGRPQGRPRTAVFAGRLEGWKGLLLAVDALSRTPGWRLDVFGEGPDRGAAERLARRRQVGDRVVFHGAVPLGEVHAALATADALLFPTMHDSSPFVVAEAIAMQCPVVCLDRGGPADMVDAGTGVVVDSTSPDLPGALARALETAGSRPYDGRWGPGRIPDQLSQFYRLAVEQHARGGP